MSSGRAGSHNSEIGVIDSAKKEVESHALHQHGTTTNR